MFKTRQFFPAAAAIALWVLPVPAAAQVGGKEQRIQVQNGTWKGRLVDSGCYKRLGAAALDAPNLPCTIDAMKKGGTASFIGLLTDGDGLFKIIGEMTKDNYAKLRDFVGKPVEMTGRSALPIGGWATRELDATKIGVSR